VQVDEEHVQAWAAELEQLRRRIAPRFYRVEMRRRAGAFIRGLLSSVERKNGWQLAEQAGEAIPDGMQRLLSRARWDVDGVRDDLRDHVVEHLGEPGGVLVVEETGFVKKGTKSAGVQRQYSGTAGRIENCQLGVFLAYASSTGQALIDRELYLPKSWTQDRARCREAGVPDEAGLATKSQLAQRMLERALDAGVPVAWLTADEAYGQDGGLRWWLEQRGIAHVLATRRTQQVIGMDLCPVTAEHLVAELPGPAWERLSAGAGAKGPRLYDWAAVAIRPLREPGVGHWLLVRRSLDDGEMAYYVCCGPEAATLAELVAVAGARWAVECCFEQAKARPAWTTTRPVATTPGMPISPWRCWLTPSSPSCAPSRWLHRRPILGASKRAQPELLVPLSVPEARRLLALLVWRQPTDPAGILDWSAWRRRHQARACQAHWRTRLKKQPL
jgi:SRSO17 transposase